jgi:DNA-binding NtrC family response regulator
MGAGKDVVRLPRVLVVDDEVSLRVTLAANLELEGFEVAEADGGEQALAILEKEKFDLVLSDIRMPHMTGVELLHVVRKRFPDLPVVLMTAFALEGLTKDAIGNGAFTIVPKPFEIASVVEALVRASRRPAVLVVDGTKEGSMATATLLQASGIRARAAFDAKSALQAVRDDAVDVCVLELSLCETSDPLMITRLHEADPGIVVIAVSGGAAPELLRRAAQQGAFAFVQRPFRTDEMLELIAKARLAGGATRPLP